MQSALGKLSSYTNSGSVTNHRNEHIWYIFTVFDKAHALLGIKKDNLDHSHFINVTMHKSLSVNLLVFCQSVSFHLFHFLFDSFINSISSFDTLVSCVEALFPFTYCVSLLYFFESDIYSQPSYSQPLSLLSTIFCYFK